MSRPRRNPAFPAAPFTLYMTAQAHEALRKRSQETGLSPGAYIESLLLPGDRHAPFSDDTAVAILRDMLDPDECHHDHHGYCQAHGWLTDGECPHARARRLIGSLDT